MQNLEGQAYEFPGAFEVAVMGAADGGLIEALPALIEAVGAQVLAGSLRIRESSAGNYISVSISFLASDRPQLDAVHESVRTHPAVRWLL